VWVCVGCKSVWLDGCKPMLPIPLHRYQLGRVYRYAHRCHGSGRVSPGLDGPGCMEFGAGAKMGEIAERLAECLADPKVGGSAFLCRIAVLHVKRVNLGSGSASHLQTAGCHTRAANSRRT
jgi:hypothetical protein